MTFFCTRTDLGLDIQPDAIRFVKLIKHHPHYGVEVIHEEAFTEDIFAEGKIKKWEVLQLILENLVARFHLQKFSTVIQVPSFLVRMNQLQVPKGLSHAAIQEEIEIQVKKELPGLNETLYLDFLEVASEKDHKELYYAAAREWYLTLYLRCLKSAGLHVTVIDIDVYALCRMIQYAMQLSIGFKEVNMLIYLAKEQAFFLSFNHQAIGYCQLLTTELSHLYQEIKVTLQRMMTANKDKSFQILTYGSSDYREVLSSLSDHVSVVCHYINPFEFLLCDDKDKFSEDMSAFIIACGLAMRRGSHDRI